ncbi:MAG: response regulator transcription factor, partial [Ruminococcus sp.]|nr:response regulator transcription factor [Ruminococcus sp.]
MKKILLVEDDKSIIANLSEFLTKEGFSVVNAEGQTRALEIIGEERFDLVLLDVSLADGNGFAVCSAIKSEYSTPVIFLTASGDEYSTVTGFELGADDYIAKPFRPRELILRIKNILRLTGGTGSVTQLGDVTIDTEKGIASRNGNDLYLSALEYRLLLVFLNNRGVVLSRNQLLEA